MDLARATQIVETLSTETANQYLRFGWKLVSQVTVEARDGRSAGVRYTLASFRTLEDTRQLVSLDSVAEANDYLQLGWRLIDKVVSQVGEGPRNEEIKFVLAWFRDEPPILPGMERVEHRPVDPTMFDDLGDFSQLPILDEEEPKTEGNL
jgi:hypothetical protein